MKWLPVLLLVFVLQEAVPEITVDVRPLEPNQVGVIRVTVTNPSTADLLWGNRLKIEDQHSNIVPIQAEYALAHEIRSGQTDIGELTFQVKKEAEAGEYPIKISLSGGVGPCEEGCVPYFIEKEVTIKVIRTEPDIEVTQKVGGTHIAVTLTNRGSGKAHDVTCDTTTVGTILPGEQKNITIDKKSTFTVTYKDEYGKQFTQSFRITESKQESSAQGVLVVLGILSGYFLRKYRD